MGVPPMSPMGILPMSLPAEASAKAGATGDPPVGFPSHGRAGTALRLAGKMPVPRCAHAGRRIVKVYHPPSGRSRISYRGRPNVFRLVVFFSRIRPVLVGVLHVGVGGGGSSLVALHALGHRAPCAVLERDLVGRALRSITLLRYSFSFASFSLFWTANSSLAAAFAALPSRYISKGHGR